MPNGFHLLNNAQMIAVISQCEMTVDKLNVVRQMNQEEAGNYAKLHKG